MEFKGDVGGVVVIDDYGHHPTAIEQDTRRSPERYPGRRVWAVYEPLTYHRTAAMLDEFAHVLATADEVAIADIWAGRDQDTTDHAALPPLPDAVTSGRGGPTIRGRRRGLVGGRLAERLGRAASSAADVVFVMGGGRSYVIAQRLVRGRVRLRTSQAEFPRSASSPVENQGLRRDPD